MLFSHSPLSGFLFIYLLIICVYYLFFQLLSLDSGTFSANPRSLNLFNHLGFLFIFIFIFIFIFLAVVAI